MYSEYQVPVPGTEERITYEKSLARESVEWGSRLPVRVYTYGFIVSDSQNILACTLLKCIAALKLRRLYDVTRNYISTEMQKCESPKPINASTTGKYKFWRGSNFSWRLPPRDSVKSKVLFVVPSFSPLRWSYVTQCIIPTEPLE